MTAQLCQTNDATVSFATQNDRQTNTMPLIFGGRRTSYARHADSIKIKRPKVLGSDLMIFKRNRP